MTKEQFKVIFSTKLVEAYPHIEVNRFKTKLYWDHFREIPGDKFSEAINSAISKESYFPTVATINKYLENIIGGLVPFEEDYCLIKEVMDKTYNNGSWNKSEYPEIVGRIIDSCGYVSGLRQLSSESLIYTVQKKYYDIVRDLKRKENGIKQLR